MLTERRYLIKKFLFDRWQQSQADNCDIYRVSR